MRRNHLKILVSIIGGGLVLLVILFSFQNLSEVLYAKGDELKVWFFDVGQGDAHLIVAPGGTQILIDGGGDQSVLQKLGMAMPFWDRTIEAIVLTHPHDDHVFGLIEVLRRYKVEQVYMTDVEHHSPAFLEFLNILENLKSEVVIIDQLATLKFSEEIELKFLYPLASFENNEIENLNNSSIVNQLNFGQIKILFTGDLEEEGEAELVRVESLENVDVYKAGHHGSRTSSSRGLLETIQPEEVFIPVGEDNSYGHPAVWTLMKFENLGAQVFRADLDGDVLLTTDGRDYEMRSVVPFLGF